MPSVVHNLMQTIEDRKANPQERSYTVKLLTGGAAKIAGKIAEETVELIEAADEAGEEGRRHAVMEAADLVYHTLVMLAHCDVKLADVEAELSSRFGVSGIDEKESRGKSQDPES